MFDRVKELVAREFGFTPGEIASVNDPRMLKVLYRMFIDNEGNTPRGLEQASSGLGPEPTPQSKESARARSALMDEEQIGDWMRRRNDQFRRSFAPSPSNRRR